MDENNNGIRWDCSIKLKYATKLLPMLRILEYYIKKIVCPPLMFNFI